MTQTQSDGSKKSSSLNYNTFQKPCIDGGLNQDCIVLIHAIIRPSGSFWRESMIKTSHQLYFRNGLSLSKQRVDIISLSAPYDQRVSPPLLLARYVASSSQISLSALQQPLSHVFCHHLLSVLFLSFLDLILLVWQQLKKHKKQKEVQEVRNILHIYF